MKIIYNLIRNINSNNLVSLFFVTAVLFIFSYQDIIYYLNDDVALELCYSGYFSGGVPVSDHMFQHFFLTQILAIFYNVIQTISWYFYIHLFFLAVSFYAMYHLLKNETNKFFLLGLMLTLLYIEYISFTYTRISIYVTFSGFLFFLKYKKIERSKLLFSFGLIFCGSLIRPEAAILTLFLFLLLYITNESFKEKIADNNVKKQLVVSILIPLFILISHKFSNTENLKRFPLAELGEGTEYVSSEFSEQLFDSNDYFRVRKFYFDERFTSKKVVDFVRSKKQKESIKARIVNSSHTLWDFYDDSYYIFLGVIIALQIILVNNFNEKIKYVCIVIFLNGFLIFLNSNFNMPLYKDRVIQPLLIIIIISFYIKYYAFDSKIKIIINAVILLVFSYILYSAILAQEFLNQNKNKNINLVFNRIPNNELVFDPTMLSLTEIIPSHRQFGNTKSFKSTQILPLGWTQRSFSSKILYKKFGVSGMDDLLVKANTTVIIDSNNFFIWKDYGVKYLNRDLISYDSVFLDNRNSYFYLARYKIIDTLKHN